MFVVIEGIDGAGCEVQSKQLLARLQNLKIPSELYKYPDYKRNIGPLIKRFLYQNQNLPVETQFLAYAMQFVVDTPYIETARKEKIFIANAFFSSTLCYQTIFGFPIKKALEFGKMFKIAKPDLIIFLDVDSETSMKRKSGEDKKKNWMEKDKQLNQKTYIRYNYLAKKQVWAKWIKVDGSGTIDEIAEKIFGIIVKRYRKSGLTIL